MFVLFWWNAQVKLLNVTKFYLTKQNNQTMLDRKHCLIWIYLRLLVIISFDNCHFRASLHREMLLRGQGV